MFELAYWVYEKGVRRIIDRRLQRRPLSKKKRQWMHKELGWASKFYRRIQEYPKTNWPLLDIIFRVIISLCRAIYMPKHIQASPWLQTQTEDGHEHEVSSTFTIITVQKWWNHEDPSGNQSEILLATSSLSKFLVSSFHDKERVVHEVTESCGLWIMGYLWVTYRLRVRPRHRSFVITAKTPGGPWGVLGFRASVTAPS